MWGMAKKFKELAEKFKEFCRTIGGKYNQYQDLIECLKEDEWAGLIHKYIDDFARIALEEAPSVGKTFALVLKDNSLLGGLYEATEIDYDPQEGLFTMYAKFYSTFGLDIGGVKDVAGGTIKSKQRKVVNGHEITLDATGDVEESIATESIVGRGEAVASVPLSAIKDKDVASVLGETFSEVMKKANDIANEALKELIISTWAE